MLSLVLAYNINRPGLYSISAPVPNPAEIWLQQNPTGAR